MKKGIIVDTLIIACIILSLISLALYFYNFHTLPLSKQTSDWSNLGSYLAGTLGPLLSFASILLVLKSIDYSNRNHESLMILSNENKTIDQIKDMSEILKDSLRNHYIFKNPDNHISSSLSTTISTRIFRMMPNRFDFSIEDVAINAIRDFQKEFESQVKLVVKIISLINNLKELDKDAYKILVEAKLTDDERAVLYCYMCKFYPDEKEIIMNLWPSFCGPCFNE